jgi:hypothetical protein
MAACCSLPETNGGAPAENFVISRFRPDDLILGVHRYDHRVVRLLSICLPGPQPVCIQDRRSWHPDRHHFDAAHLRGVYGLNQFSLLLFTIGLPEIHSTATRILIFFQLPAIDNALA